MTSGNTGHPTEDDLVLLFYGDTSPADEGRLAAHVDACDQCRPLWQDIQASLAAIDAAGSPEPPADFERVMWARVQREIEGMRPATNWWAPSVWMPVVTLAAVVLAVVATMRMPDDGAPPLAGDTTISSTQPERALLIAMDDHLERSELLLIEVMNAPTDTDAVTLGFEREAADDLLMSSRLYRQTAAHTGNVEFASMLEDLERVLVEIARGPNELNQNDLNTLRAHIEEEDLLFKMRVVTDEVRRRQQAIATVSEGDL
jgi:hypothetical protein